jgi:hypothetical protein
MSIAIPTHPTKRIFDMGTSQRSRYGIVRAAWIEHPEVGADEIAVLAVLAVHADTDGVCWPSQGTIAGQLGRSRPWVIGVINRLVDESGGLRSCHYRLSKPEDAASGTAGNHHGHTRDGAGRRDDSPCHHGDTEQTQPNSKDSLGAADTRRGERGPDEGPTDDGKGVIEPGWVPTAADVAWAKARHPDLDVLAFTEAFVLSCRAKGYRYADPSAAWRRWLAEPKGRLPRLTPPSSATAPNTASNRDHHHDDRRPHHRHRGSARPFGPSATGPGVAERNAERAAACLERILGRRAGGPPAGPAAGP